MNRWNAPNIIVSNWVMAYNKWYMEFGKNPRYRETEEARNLNEIYEKVLENSNWAKVTYTEKRTYTMSWKRNTKVNGNGT